VTISPDYLLEDINLIRMTLNEIVGDKRYVVQPLAELNARYNTRIASGKPVRPTADATSTVIDETNIDGLLSALRRVPSEEAMQAIVHSWVMSRPEGGLDPKIGLKEAYCLYVNYVLDCYAMGENKKIINIKDSTALSRWNVPNPVQSTWDTTGKYLDTFWERSATYLNDTMMDIVFRPKALRLKKPYSYAYGLVASLPRELGRVRWEGKFFPLPEGATHYAGNEEIIAFGRSDTEALCWLVQPSGPNEAAHKPTERHLTEEEKAELSDAVTAPRPAAQAADLNLDDLAKPAELLPTLRSLVEGYAEYRKTAPEPEPKAELLVNTGSDHPDREDEFGDTCAWVKTAGTVFVARLPEDRPMNARLGGEEGFDIITSVWQRAWRLASKLKHRPFIAKWVPNDLSQFHSVYGLGKDEDGALYDLINKTAKRYYASDIRKDVIYSLVVRTKDGVGRYLFLSQSSMMERCRQLVGLSMLCGIKHTENAADTETVIHLDMPYTSAEITTVFGRFDE
jgi:hypothetical protein